MGPVRSTDSGPVHEIRSHTGPRSNHPISLYPKRSDAMKVIWSNEQRTTRLVRYGGDHYNPRSSDSKFALFFFPSSLIPSVK